MRTGGAFGAVQAPHVARRATVTSGLAVAVTLGSLYVVWLNHPGRREVLGGVVVLAAGTLAIALQRVHLLRVLLLATAGGVCLALTSRDYFSFWPAASVLLAIAAATPVGASRGSSRLITAVAAFAGLLWAGFGPAGDFVPPLLPLVVAGVVLLVEHHTSSLLARARELEAKADHLRSRAEASEAVNLELERRTALARELHDSLGHHVTAIVVQAEAGQVGGSDEVLTKIADLGRAALDELEAVLFDLRLPSGDEQFVDPVDLDRIDTKLAQPLREQGAKVGVTISTDERRPAVLAAIYRITQEALTNAMRHSGATEVFVAVSDEAADVMVRVRDNGVGLPSQTLRGQGLAGIHERALRLGGDATLVAAVPHGTLVQVRIPRVAT